MPQKAPWYMHALLSPIRVPITLFVSIFYNAYYAATSNTFFKAPVAESISPIIPSSTVIQNALGENTSKVDFQHQAQGPGVPEEQLSLSDTQADQLPLENAHVEDDQAPYSKNP